MLQWAAVEEQIADDPRDPASAGFELFEDGQAAVLASLREVEVESCQLDKAGLMFLGSSPFFLSQQLVATL